MTKLRTVYMGTPDFAVPCLDRLISDGHDLCAVVTQPDRPKGRGRKLCPSPVKEAALRYGLPVLQPEKVKNPEFITQLTEIKPEIIIVVAFGQLLPKAILDLPDYGCINVHASLLPKYRGAAPIHWSVINGDTVTGVTTMYMDIGMDTGDIILKAEIPIGPNDCTGNIHDRLKILGSELLSETVAKIAEGTAPRIPQEHTEATYAPLLTREVEKINWSRSAQEIHNLVRGLNPWPGAYCLFQGKMLKIWETRVADRDSKANPAGKIAAISQDGIIIATGCGLIELLTVQPECRNRMRARDCVSGYCLVPGEMLR